MIAEHITTPTPMRVSKAFFYFALAIFFALGVLTTLLAIAI